jgi:hypothetical protein
LTKPATDMLAGAVARLTAEEREFLRHTLVDERPDADVAESADVPEYEVKWKRAELVNRIAIETGVTDASEVPGVATAIAALPAAAWEDVPDKPSRPSAATIVQHAGIAWLLLLPGALTAYLAFQSGGYFPGTTGIVAAVALVSLVVRLTVAERPFEGFSLPVAGAALALGGFTVWVLLSGGRSGSSARALVEFDRSFLYLAVVVLAGSLVRTPARIRWMVRGVAAAITIVCAVALASRVLPDLVTAPDNIQNDRLSYPLSYWNAMGLFAALGCVAGFALTSDEREPWAVRLLAAGSLPIAATSLLLTFSRSAIAVVAIGIVVLVVLARTRALWTALLAVAPPTAIALVAAYDADRIATDTYRSAAAQHQEHHVALVVGLAVLATIALRALLVPVDTRIARLRLRESVRRPLLGALAGAGILVAIVAAIALHAPRELHDQYDTFVHSSAVKESGPTRNRLGNASNNGRLGFWRVARDDFRDHPLSGTGAGSFQVSWARERPSSFTLVDAHSLYFETGAELGIIGLLAIALFLLTLFGGVLARCRGKERAPYAAIMALGAVWLVHAGLDWDWEMPAVTLPVFALGAFALAGERPRFGAPRRPARVVGGLAILLLAITPVLFAVSQHRLDEAVTALRKGDCTTAIDRALAANSALGVRPEPFEVLGYCDARSRGTGSLGADMMRKAIARDKKYWRYWYGLALARGAARLDPRAAARRAHELNPRSSLTRGAVRGFATTRPARWERVARASRLPYYVR